MGGTLIKVGAEPACLGGVWAVLSWGWRWGEDAADGIPRPPSAPDMVPVPPVVPCPSPQPQCPHSTPPCAPRATGREDSGSACGPGLAGGGGASTAPPLPAIGTSCSSLPKILAFNSPSWPNQTAPDSPPLPVAKARPCRVARRPRGGEQARACSASGCVRLPPPALLFFPPQIWLPVASPGPGPSRGSSGDTPGAWERGSAVLLGQGWEPRLPAGREPPALAGRGVLGCSRVGGPGKPRAILLTPLRDLFYYRSTCLMQMGLAGEVVQAAAAAGQDGGGPGVRGLGARVQPGAGAVVEQGSGAGGAGTRQQLRSWAGPS